MIVKLRVYRLLFFLFFLLSFLSVFSWNRNPNSIRIVYLIYLFIIFKAFESGITMNRVFKFSLLFLLIHIISFVLSFTVYSLPINYSWFLQGVILILLIPSSSIITNSVYFSNEFRRLGKLFFWITLSAGLIGIFYGLKNYGIIWIFSGYDQRLTYEFNAAMDIGLLKQLFPFYLNILLILFWFQIPKKLLVIILIIDIIILLLVGSRTIMFSLFLLFLIAFFFHKIKNKNKRKYLLWLLSIFVIYIVFIFHTQLYEITTKSGRFYFQLFSSDTFWKRPFGVGLGNYGKSVEKGLWDNIKLDRFSWLSISYLLKNTDIGINHNLYPIAESDIILLGGSYGVIGLFIWLFLGFRYLNKFILYQGSKDSSLYLGLILFLFIFFSGFLNDFLSSPITWLFIGIAVNQIESENIILDEYA